MLELNSIDFDHRVSTYAASARVSYGWYLSKTRGSEHNLNIQRAIIKGKKTYETLREDLRRGCILPPLVLSAQNLTLPSELNAPPTELFYRSHQNLEAELARLLDNIEPDAVQIIDGLQRTNAIRSVSDALEGEAKDEFLARPLRVEFWLNIPFYALAYRMLLLNAGQKPMSMKHQIEILADSLRIELLRIQGIEILRGLDHRRRAAPGQFQLSTLASAFQAWIQKQPNVDLRNAVTEQLLAEEAVHSLGASFTPGNHDGAESFGDFVKWLVRLDTALGKDYLFFLGNETVILAISAAVASAQGKPLTKDRCEQALETLASQVELSQSAEPLSPEMFEEFRREIDPKKSNVGQATREFVYRAFSEFIMSGGDKPMAECWVFASTYI
ncbi:hypothetical protein [Maricaulis parjimensis]|uniref:hypothetical protein n=1 Tax=Maricaulis parjimensis TaxID=144023 RepID=UPI00193AC3ED|nr:hypothetical protein [Maricaulis parjimensis]